MKYILENPDKFDSFIFGSSRVNFIDPGYIRHAKYYNMTYSSGIPADHYYDIKLMLDNGVNIKNLMIGIDYLSFLENNESHDLLRRKYPVSFLDKIEFYQDYIFYIPDLIFVKRALTKEITTDRSKVFTKGILVYPDKDSVITNSKQQFTVNNKFSYPTSLRNVNPDIDKALNEISKLVTIAHENHINITFFINPTHHITYLNLRLDDYFYALEELSEITEYYDFSGLNSIAVDNLKFYETSHYTEGVGNLIIAKVFNQPEPAIPDDFGRYVTKANSKEQIAFHSALLNDYFVSTSNYQNSKPPIDLSLYKETHSNPQLSIDKINGLILDTNQQTRTITTPWLKLQGHTVNPICERNSNQIFAKIGKSLFTCEFSRNVTNEHNETNKGTTYYWQVMIPTLKLHEGLNEIRLIEVSDKSKQYAISDPLNLAIYHFKKPVNTNKLTLINGQSRLSIDGINDNMVSEVNVIDDSSPTLFIKGWASDDLNKRSAGGILVNINEKSFLSQIILNRSDVAKFFNNPKLTNAGWGISIPTSALKPGYNTLEFKILDSTISMYYKVNKKIIIDYQVKNETIDLSNMAQLHSDTKFSVDLINGINVFNTKTPVIISNNTIEILGWAVDEIAGRPAEKVIIEIDGKPFNAIYGLNRKDVAAALSNESYLKSGWKCKILSSHLNKGDHTLTLKIIAQGGATYYKIKKQYFFSTI
ncbi:MAG: hypothetical protein HOO86_03215 [Bacteroidales bacterium]|nr:hypothetical protein [Bacteroidales bacterium]